MSRFYIVVFAALLVSAAAPAENVRESLQFAKAIERSGSGEELLAVRLDAEVHAATRDGWPDLRVFDDQGQETPFVLDSATRETYRTQTVTCRSKIASLQETPDGGLLVVVELEKDELTPTSIVIHSPLRDFERRVEVSGSADGKDWKPLGPQSLVYDYTRFADVRNETITIPQNDCRKFRLAIEHVTDEMQSPLTELSRRFHDGREIERIDRTMMAKRPFRMDRIELRREASREVSREPVETTFSALAFHAAQDAKDKTTVIDVQTRREPIGAFVLETKSRNVSRRASVAAIEAKDKQVSLGAGTLCVLDFKSVRRDDRTIRFPTSRFRDYRIVVRNEDSPALDITDINATGPALQAVFLAQAGRTYRLVYGSQHVAKPVYDAAAVLPAIRSGQALTEARLGPQMGNLDFRIDAPTKPVEPWIDHPAVLLTVVAIMVAVLSWGLFFVAKKVEHLPKE